MNIHPPLKGLISLFALIAALNGQTDPWTKSGSNVYLTTSTDNVGIGTNSPGEALRVIETDTTDNLIAKFEGTNTSFDRIAVSSPASSAAGISFQEQGTTKWTAGKDANNDFAISTSANPGSAQKLFIDATSGNVGIGTSSPQSMLHLDFGNSWDNLTMQGVNDQKWVLSIYSNGDFYIGDASAGKSTIYIESGQQKTKALYIKNNGNIGIGTQYPGQKLDVVDDADGLRYLEYNNRNTGTSAGAGVWAYADGNNAFIRAYGDNHASLANVAELGTSASGTDLALFAGTEKVRIKSDGSVGIGTTSPQEQLDVNGTTQTKVIKITGGSDLAEPFAVNGNKEIKPGMVVSIDPEQSGQLRVSGQAYDRTVAGIISGAGGVNPGIIMAQTGEENGKEYPLALSGRVYAWADASSGAIKPGDLLTTSDTPGHIMKVTDYTKAQGTVIGKAMSVLEEGQGLVLVLVALQ